MSDFEETSWIDVNKNGDQEGKQIDILDENSAELIKVLQNVKVPGRGRKGRARGGTSNRAGSGRGKQAKKRKVSPLNDSITSNMEENINNDKLTENEILIQLLGEIKGLRTDIAKIDTRLNKIEDHLLAIDTRINDLERENVDFKEKLKEKEKQIKELHYKFESYEQREKQLELIISSPGVTSSSEATFKGNVIKLMKDKLKLSEDFLSRFSYRRIGQDGKWRALLKAQNYQDRIEIFQTTRLMKPTQFFVNESLIKSREDLHYRVRKYKKDNNLHYSNYSFKGEIFIKMNKTGQPIRIQDMSDIVKLFEK